MGRCKFHPERETAYKCMKHDYYLCEECLECKDPDLYCKFRSSCAIHFLSRKGFESGDKKIAEKITAQ
ncbi:hypothetical protein [Desulfocicer niacini]